MILHKLHHERPENPLARAAFTLMEMLVVVAIIVALAGLGGYYVMGQLQTSQMKTAKIKAEMISKAVENYMIDHNTPPASLEMLLTQDQQGYGPYLKTQNDLLDPWGNHYQMEIVNQNGATMPRVHTTTPKGVVVSNL